MEVGWRPMSGARASPPGVSNEDDSPKMENLSIPQLISFLQSSFGGADFEKAERILVSREESLKAEIERSFIEELTLKEVEKIEAVARCQGLERESTALRAAAADLERYLEEEKEKHALLAAKLEESEKDKLVSREDMEKYKSACERLEEEITRLKEDYSIKRAPFLETQKENFVEQEECGKRKAQDEIDEWKRKCEELEARILRLAEEKGNRQLCESSKNQIGEDSGSRIRAQLLPELEVGSHGNEDLAVQASKEPAPGGIIDISDSEDDIKVEANYPKLSMQIDQKNVGAVKDEDSSSSKDLRSTFTPKRKCISTIVTSDGEDEDDCSKVMQMDQTIVGAVQDDGNICSKNYPSTLTPKRKCLSRIVTSDSEDDVDNDDRIPLSKLKLRKIGNAMKGDEGSNGFSVDCSFCHDDIQEDVTPSRRRLVPLRECHKTKGVAIATSSGDSNPQTQSPMETKKTISRNRTNVRRMLGFPDTKHAEEDEVQEEKMLDDDVRSESEGESLGGFIVDDSDGQESDSCSNDGFGEEEQSDSDVDLNDVLAKIRRGKATKKWEYEADMLSSFSQNPELCMKAVCALYRQQTCEEQSIKEAIVSNKRGFSMLDAKRGSWMAEFLTDGDPHSPLKKSVQELRERDPQGVEYCFKLATHYSKQLFIIYQNKEDPFFLPS